VFFVAFRCACAGLTRDVDFEVGAAAAIDPDAAGVVAPGDAIDAVGVAALANDANAAHGVDGANVPAAVVGGAVDDALLWRIPAGLADFEVGAAAAIDPNAVAIPAPRGAEGARRAAALADETNAAAGVHRAAIAAAVIGGAVDVVIVAPAGPGRRSGRRPGHWRASRLRTGDEADGEVGAATAIDPDALAVPAPGLIEGAGGAAALVDELNTAAGVGGTIFAAAVVGGAVEIGAGGHALRRGCV